MSEQLRAIEHGPMKSTLTACGIGLLFLLVGQIAAVAQPVLEVLRPNASDRLQPGALFRIEWRVLEEDRGRDWNFFLETNEVHIGRLFPTPEEDGNGNWHAYVTIPNEAHPFSRWDDVWVELPSSCRYALRIHDDASEADGRSATFCLGVPELTARASPVEICWNSRSNRAYQVQFRPALTSGAWTNLGSTVQGNGRTNCVTDAVTAGQPQRYYRVEEIP